MKLTESCKGEKLKHLTADGSGPKCQLFNHGM